MAKEKTAGIYFKLSEAERHLIERKMELAGVHNMSAYIRKMCIDGYTVTLDISQLNEIGRLLRMTSNNINQIARRVNSGGTAYREDVAEVLQQFEAIRREFGQVLGELAKLK